jgi:hypothetical protein
MDGLVYRVALALAVHAVGLAVTASATATVPVPDQDPFYAVPANISGLPNGTILASRQVSANFYSLPDLASAWQVKYKTIDVHGNPNAYVATILVPVIPWTGTGPRPLVSYQTAEDGVGSKCSPSYALRAGLPALPANSESETGLMELALLRGFALVVPDYEGPRSEFLGVSGEAHGVLDGIRAALHFNPAGFSSRTPVGLWGYSGGSYASDVAAQAEPAYAPELRIAGVALGGFVADVRATMQAFSGGPLGGALAIGFVGVNRSYPQWNLMQYLNAAGREAVAGAQNDCINDAVARYPLASFQQYEAYPGVLDLPIVNERFRELSPLYLPGTPTAPIYDYHEVLDELAPIGPDRTTMARFCAAGAAVDHVELLTGEHIAGVVTGAPGALDFLAGRFAGQPAVSDCATLRQYASSGPPSPTCASPGAVILEVRGAHIRRLAVIWHGRRIAARRGSNLHTIRLAGLAPGRYVVRLRVYGARHHWTVTRRLAIGCRAS